MVQRVRLVVDGVMVVSALEAIVVSASEAMVVSAMVVSASKMSERLHLSSVRC